MLIVAFGLVPSVAQADPVPGFSFDAVRLEADMHRCMSYEVSETYVLMGWMKMSTGEQRHWRCSSLRHMILDVDDRESGASHDPFADVRSFMHCIDELVSYGFPVSSNKPQNARFGKNFNGTASQACVVVNKATGDVVTAWTTPRPDDWAGCARPLFS